MGRLLPSVKLKRDFEHWLASRHGLSRAELRRELERVEIDTLDRWAFGVAGDDVITVKPRDLAIVHLDDLDNAVYQAGRYPGGQAAWAKSVSLEEPVEISVTTPGQFVLEDGHHRYLAAKLLKRSLTGKVSIKGKPIEELLARTGRKTAEQLDREIAELMDK